MRRDRQFIQVLCCCCFADVHSAVEEFYASTLISRNIGTSLGSLFPNSELGRFFRHGISAGASAVNSVRPAQVYYTDRSSLFSIRRAVRLPLLIMKTQTQKNTRPFSIFGLSDNNCRAYI